MTQSCVNPKSQQRNKGVDSDLYNWISYVSRTTKVENKDEMQSEVPTCVKKKA